MPCRQPITARLLLFALPLLLLAGCASREQIAREEISDPFEPVNRAFFAFNDKADQYVVRPVAVAYRNTLPRQLRAGIRNVLNNLQEPVTIVSQFLQGKPKDGARDTARFVMNSTVGLFGLFDPATEVGLERHDEDFGQVLRLWGVPSGPYFMVPVFGPYTLSHGAGSLLEAPVSPFINRSNVTQGLALWAVDGIDDRSRLLDADDEYRRAFDRYLFVREAYWQNRKYRILDGDIPDDALFPEDEFPEDEFEDEVTEDSPPAGDGAAGGPQD